jgi:hypothetical protein
LQQIRHKSKIQKVDKMEEKRQQFHSNGQHVLAMKGVWCAIQRRTIIETSDYNIYIINDISYLSRMLYGSHH